MKKVILFLAVVSYCLNGLAQEKISGEQARLICAQEMAAFTKAVSGAYVKGNSYDQFKFTLCGKLQPTTEGSNQLKVAYNFIIKGASSDFIIKSYNGKEIAASLNYLYNLHQKGLESDGAELFGGTTGSSNSGLSKAAEGPCRWYQLWCHMQPFANWVVANWPVIREIIAVLLVLFP